MEQEQGVAAEAASTRVGSGLLGAEASGPYAAQTIGSERLLMIERRILRIEMAMRQTGVEVESLELPRP